MRLRGAGALEALHVGKPEEIGDDRLPAAVLVDPVGMQAVAASAGLGVHQRQAQVIAAQEPGKGAGRTGLPGCVAAFIDVMSNLFGRRTGNTH